MNKEDKIIELLEKILSEVSSIESNTSCNDMYLGSIQTGVENILEKVNE